MMAVLHAGSGSILLPLDPRAFMHIQRRFPGYSLQPGLSGWVALRLMARGDWPNMSR